MFEDEVLDGPALPRENRTEAPRVRTANRKQLQLRSCDLESTLGADHVARTLWSVVERLDLSKFYEGIVARGSAPGRSATDPKILVTLWLYATSEAVGSARELARLCESHDAYRWICGGVPMNHHTLSDFRVGHEKELDELLTQTLAVMMRNGLVKLKRVAQDGMRVRAHAGAASFRREKKLRHFLEIAKSQVERLKAEGDSPDPQRSARERAAQERATREREERIERALEQLPGIRKSKTSVKDKENARASTTDPESRIMKMADGGFRPAYNLQLATDTESRVVVGVRVSNVGSDMGLMEPMLREIETRAGRAPEEHLVDGGFSKKEDIEAAAARGVTVYAPVPTPRVEGIDPHAPKDDDPEAVATWRRRMGTEEAKQIYKERAATAETVNADLRTLRGIDRLLVRGADKVKSVLLWGVLAYNLLRWTALA